MNRMNSWMSRLPHALLLLSILYVASHMRPDRSDGWNTGQFGRLPVQDLGRVKPIDTLARTSLMVLSNRQSFYTAGESGGSDRKRLRNPHKTPAVRWLLDVVARPSQARTYEVFRIDHPDVLALIGAPDTRKYFSLNEIMANEDRLLAQFDQTRAIDKNDWTPYQRQLMNLHNKLSLYFTLEDAERLRFVPSPDGQADWLTLRTSDAPGRPTDSSIQYARSVTAAFIAWRDQDATQFNAAVQAAGLGLGDVPAPRRARLTHEYEFNHMAPFIVAMSLYVFTFVLALLSWLRYSAPLSKASLWILGLALVIHTAGLISRIYIQGRPPVTNLYSSAIFVGWGAAVLGFVLERLYRNGVGTATAASLGFLTLLVAHNLSMDGDTMTMMQAVLDTNFWLATHVVVITLGYGATFLAGFLSILYILRGVFTRGLDQATQASLSRMIYGIIAFATLFSFVGTILGGIWADQSWGRFWGWDPKENGALLIVLWNALILHARWGGMVRHRGIAVLGVAGNIVTSWSWFGTNMLGVGLHAYGFIDSALLWMFIFVASQLAIIAIGLTPPHKWRSYAAKSPAPVPVGPLPVPTRHQ
ncbi:MAG TPA: cytochrome c biogenesis protein CcsA [Candidatus Eisenbacteria bacterium]